MEDEKGQGVATGLRQFGHEDADAGLDVGVVGDVSDARERLAHRPRHERLLQRRQERLEDGAEHVHVDRRQLRWRHLALQQLLLPPFLPTKLGFCCCCFLFVSAFFSLLLLLFGFPTNDFTEKMSEIFCSFFVRPVSHPSA